MKKVIYIKKNLYAQFKNKNISIQWNVYFHFRKNFLKNVDLFQVELKGGRCIIVPCDHSRDDDVDILFEQIRKEQDGRLDILINNAYSASQVRNLYKLVTERY